MTAVMLAAEVVENEWVQLAKNWAPGLFFLALCLIFAYWTK